MLMQGFVSLVLFFASAAAWAGGDMFVGNSGEVLRVGKQLVLRDLYEKEKVVGNEVFPVIHQGLQYSKLNRLPMSQAAKNMLANKLTDIERLHRNLGVFLLEGARLYEWEFTNETLKSATNDPMPINLSLPKFTAANRLLQTIRIQRALWYEMNDETKVALIIHELVYSFVTANCTDRGVCAQSPAITRELVAKAYSASSGVDYRLSPNMQLQINGLTLVDPNWNGMTLINLELYGAEVTQFTKYARLAEDSTMLAYNPEAREQMIQRLCGNVVTRGKVVVTAEWPAAIVTNYTYRADREFGFQFGLCIVPKDQDADSKQTEIDVMSTSDCMSSLRIFFDQLYQPPTLATCDKVMY